MPERNSDLGTKEQVFGLAFGDQIRTYPLSLFENQALIHDTLADRNVVIFAVASGVGVWAYDHDGHTITRSQSSTDQKTILTDEVGVDWWTEDNALVNLDGSGRTLEQLSNCDSYRFDWYAFYPHTDTHSP